MLAILSAFICGLLFGVGLIVSQVANPAKVLDFLDVFGRWDPSLIVTMGGAVAASALGTIIARRMGVPVLASRLEIPTRRDLDARLIGGAVLFGVGWGLAGLCPGPALTAVTFGPWPILIFVIAMITGMALFRIMPFNWPQMNLRGRASGTSDRA